MDQLQVSARFPRIAPEKLDEFKKVAAQALEITRGDAGTLQYDWFLSADETVCEVHEVYADSDAALAHMAGLGALVGSLIELGGGIQIDCFGSPSQALLEAAAALSPTLYSYLQGK